MLLSRGALGACSLHGQPGMRRPPPGFHSVQGVVVPAGAPLYLPLAMSYAVFDGHQAYPEYVLHFE